ncbi:FAD:protein FMN transferase [Granulosicoccaceae sp. 1_MG-2023]|nr:FAD:protein FMN transferase [Granulosicoccaceae sp. 1_MG-2023]
MKTSSLMTSVAKRLPSLLPALLLAACSSQSDLPAGVTLTGHTMGTSYSITLADKPADISPDVLQTEIDTRLEAINAEMSTYIDDSVISTFNHTDTTDWFPVSADFADLVSVSLEISQATEGAYDVTLGPLVDLWGFGGGSEQGEDRIPSAQEIEATRARTGYDKLSSRAEPSAIRKDHGDLEIDLSSIAKGYGVDEIAGLLEQHGVSDYLVEIGGELRVKGHSPRGDAWKIAVEKPDAGQQSVQRVISVGDRAIATSGDYRNYFEKDGKRYSHTIDARSGRPVINRLASVTVLADRAALSDGWATALMALGEARAPAVAEKNELAAYFIIKADEGFRLVETPAFTALTSANTQ